MDNFDQNLPFFGEDFNCDDIEEKDSNSSISGNSGVMNEHYSENSLSSSSYWQNDYLFKLV